LAQCLPARLVNHTSVVYAFEELSITNLSINFDLVSHILKALIKVPNLFLCNHKQLTVSLKNILLGRLILDDDLQP